MSRRLLLLRHAKSDRPEGIADHERPLSLRGKADAPIIGHYMEAHELIPDLALVSTSQRTRETWELAKNEFGISVPTKFDKRIYEARPSALLYLIRETEPSISNLIMVGHNPGFEELAHLLIGSGDIVARQALATKYPTASLAVIDFTIDDWRNIEEHSGRLDRFITPRVLAPSDD